MAKEQLNVNVNQSFLQTVVILKVIQYNSIAVGYTKRYQNSYDC